MKNLFLNLTCRAFNASKKFSFEGEIFFEMTEKKFAETIAELGGTAYLVGGAVRDKFRGVEAHDKDYCVTGIEEKDFVVALPKAVKVGKSFPVYNVRIDDVPCEVAFARKEWKSGLGYRGFKFTTDSSVTIEEDLFRRDTTINAIAVNLLTGEFTDPFNGREDIFNKKIRAVSEHFSDDPVRALRAARQSAQFNFEICEETFERMKLCGEELKLEPTERIFNELHAALKTDKPSIFFRNLERAELLKTAFPEIERLRGKVQPSAYHPEGDAYEHSLKILDDVAAVNENPCVRFAALVHDIGKGTTPAEMLPHHYFHEMRGGEVLKEMNARMALPNDWKKTAAFVIKEHMRAPMITAAGKITDFLIRLHNSKISAKDFNDVIRADHGSLPPHLEKAEFLTEQFLKVRGNNAPLPLKGYEVGEWVRRERIKIFVNLRNDL